MAITVQPLCIIQARYHSTRLPGKMLQKLGDETLMARAWRIACEAFNQPRLIGSVDNCVVAIPASDEAGPLGDELRRVGARVYAWQGPENDALSRFYHCAHAYRWHPDSAIVRYTPDDPFKTVDGLRRVAAGERLPVEIGGEAFTLAMLDAYVRSHGRWQNEREHITFALFPTLPPPCPPGAGWTIDTEADYEAAKARLAK